LAPERTAGDKLAPERWGGEKLAPKRRPPRDGGRARVGCPGRRALGLTGNRRRFLASTARNWRRNDRGAKNWRRNDRGREIGAGTSPPTERGRGRGRRVGRRREPLGATRRTGRGQPTAPAGRHGRNRPACRLGRRQPPPERAPNRSRAGPHGRTLLGGTSLSYDTVRVCPRSHGGRGACGSAGEAAEPAGVADGDRPPPSDDQPAAAQLGQAPRHRLPRGADQP
jgi:hypothetical protein